MLVDARARFESAIRLRRGIVVNSSKGTQHFELASGTNTSARIQDEGVKTMLQDAALRPLTRPEYPDSGRPDCADSRQKASLSNDCSTLSPAHSGDGLLGEYW